MLLNTFYEYPQYRDFLFQNWLEIQHFLTFVHKNFNILDEIEHIKTKAEHPKSIKNELMFDLL